MCRSSRWEGSNYTAPLLTYPPSSSLLFRLFCLESALKMFFAASSEVRVLVKVFDRVDVI